MKTEAEKLQIAFQNIEGEEFLDSRQLVFWLNQVRSRAIDELYCCPDSSDSSVDYIFSDGSILHVANSSQDSFRCFCNLIK